MGFVNWFRRPPALSGPSDAQMAAERAAHVAKLEAQLKFERTQHQAELDVILKELMQARVELAKHDACAAALAERDRQAWLN
jgi:hypothetical protein